MKASLDVYVSYFTLERGGQFDSVRFSSVQFSSVQ